MNIQHDTYVKVGNLNAIQLRQYDSFFKFGLFNRPSPSLDGIHSESVLHYEEEVSDFEIISESTAKLYDKREVSLKDFVHTYANKRWKGVMNFTFMGAKISGFMFKEDFKAFSPIKPSEWLKDYEGMVGVINFYDYDNDSYSVKFEDGKFITYPGKLIRYNVMLDLDSGMETETAKYNKTLELLPYEHKNTQKETNNMPKNTTPPKPTERLNEVLSEYYTDNIKRSSDPNNTTFKANIKLEDLTFNYKGEICKFVRYKDESRNSIVIKGAKRNHELMLRTALSFVVDRENVFENYSDHLIPFKLFKIEFLNPKDNLIHELSFTHPNFTSRPKTASNSGVKVFGKPVDFKVVLENTDETTLNILRSLVGAEKLIGHTFKLFRFKSPKTNKAHEEMMDALVGKDVKIVSEHYNGFIKSRMFFLDTNTKKYGLIEIPQYEVIKHLIEMVGEIKESNLNSLNANVEKVDVISEPIAAETFKVDIQNTNTESVNVLNGDENTYQEGDAIRFEDDLTDDYIFVSKIDDNTSNIRLVDKKYSIPVSNEKISPKINDGEFVIIVGKNAIGIKTFDSSETYDGKVYKYRVGFVDTLIPEIQ